MANYVSFDGGSSLKTNDDPLYSGTVLDAPRLWLRLEGLLIFILSIVLFARSGDSWWRFGLLLLVPDISMVGYYVNVRFGAIAYNVVHSYVGPVVWTLVALALGHSTSLPFILIWTAHIGVDRALGYGLKYTESFKKTHLGWLGGRKEPPVA